MRYEKFDCNSIHEAVHEANRNALAQGGFELFEPKKNLIITACWNVGRGPARNQVLALKSTTVLSLVSDPAPI